MLCHAILVNRHYQNESILFSDQVGFGPYHPQSVFTLILSPHLRLSRNRGCKEGEGKGHCPRLTRVRP